MDSAVTLGLFIPCYNVATQVKPVLEQVAKLYPTQFTKIYLIDNQSTDRTLEVLEDFRKEHQHLPIEVYQNPKNIFLGGSTARAFDIAEGDQLDYLICLHSDGQASPKDLRHFIEAAKKDTYDFILGSRFLPGSQVQNYSFTRWLANRFFVMLQQGIVRKRVYDLGAFLGFRIQTMKRLPYKDIPFDMGFHPYLILIGFRRFPDLRFCEFPIYWGPVETTNINVLHYGAVHFLRLIGLFFGVFLRKGQLAKIHQI